MSSSAGGAPHSASACRFRPAEPQHAALLRNWLPPDRERGVSFVGYVSDQIHPVAAFAVAPPVERYEQPGLGLAIHIEPAYRDRNIAEHIIELAQKMAASAALGPLHAWPFPKAGSDAAELYTKLGFVEFDRVTEWETTVGSTHSVLGSALRQLRQRRRDHSIWNANDLPLERADVNQVVKLYESELAELGPLRDRWVQSLKGQGKTPFHPTISRVLVVNNEVIGFILARLEQDICTIPASVVRRDFRDGIANTRLMMSVLEQQIATPGRLIRFETHGHHHRTVGLARRIHASVRQVHLKLRLDAQA